MKKGKLLYLLLIVMLFGFVSCSNDDEPEVKDDEQEKPIDIEDPEEIGDNITFINGTATKENGEFPNATDGDAPELYSEYYDEEDLIAIAGGFLEIPIYATYESEGIYIQIEGASFYYNVVLNQKAKNGRLANRKQARKDKGSKVEAAYNTLIIELPSGLSAGDLCLKIAVYDAEKRVSNSHNICSKVTTRGGNNSAFLTANAWELESEYFQDAYEGETYESLIMVGEQYEREYPIYCDNRETYYGTEISTLLSVYLTLLQNGTIETEYIESEKRADYQAYCETGNIEIVDSQDIETSEGVWSYNDSTKELIWVVEYFFRSENEEAYGIDNNKFKVSYEDNKLILTNKSEDQWGSYLSVLTFKPKSE